MSIGETLAAAREEAGLTVARVSELTCIRETIVRGIESDDFDLCGGHFYARGHIRSIATHIGVDPEPLVQQYDDEHGGSPRAASPVQSLDEKPISVPAARRSPNWSMALVALLAVVIVYGAYSVFSGSSASQQQQESPAGEPGPIVKATTSAPDHTSSSRPSQPSQTGEPSHQRAGTVEEAREKAAIELRAQERTWISVRGSKGKELYAGTLYKGDSKRFTDEKVIRIVIGNVGGVSLTVNGKKLGVVGDSGQVLTGLRVYPDRVVGLS